jgi:hypothetical protein
MDMFRLQHFRAQDLDKLAEGIISLMARGWLIRSFFVAQCAICALAWIISYVRPVEFIVNYPAYKYVFVPFSDGRIAFLHENDVVTSHHGWGLGCRWGSHFEWRQGDQNANFHFLGFSSYSPAPREWLYSIPLWFPTFLSSLLLWFIWRKTKPKRLGGAFPVEPAESPTVAK